MNKLYRVLGKRGRITIPFEMRRRAGFSFNDVLSFTQQDDCTVVVTSTDPANGITTDYMTYKVVQIIIDGDIAFAVIYGG